MLFFEVRLVIRLSSVNVKINAFTSICRPSILFYIALHGLCRVDAPISTLHESRKTESALQSFAMRSLTEFKINRNSDRFAICAYFHKFNFSLSLSGKFTGFSHVTWVVTSTDDGRNKMKLILYFQFAECRDA